MRTIFEGEIPQDILRLKMECYNDPKFKIKYASKELFSEAFVNQLMWQAKIMGYTKGLKQGQRLGEQDTKQNIIELIESL